MDSASLKLMVDEFVKLRTRISKLAEQERIMKEMLLAELTRKKRTSLSKVKVEALLTPLQFKKCLVSTSFTKIVTHNLE